MMNRIQKNFVAGVVANGKVSDDMHRIEFECLNDNFVFIEGQFVMIENLFDEKRVVRAYSISSKSEILPKFELIVKRVKDGLMSNFLCDLNVGEQINLSGPYGDFLWNKGVNKNKVLVAIGCGLAPIKSILLKQIENVENNIELYLGSRYLKEAPLSGYFEDLVRENANFKFYPCISREQEGCRYCGRVNDVMLKQNIDFANTDFYLCGTAEMIDGIKQLVVDNGGSLENIYNENIYPYVADK